MASICGQPRYMTSLMLWLMCICYVCFHGTEAETESSLIHKLVGPDSGYNTAVRPWAQKNSVNVTIDIAIHQLLGVDEREQILKIVVWMRWWWTDPRLMWSFNTTNSTGHLVCEGVEGIYLHSYQIWIPDITLYNSVKDTGFIWQGHYMPYVSNTGQITWLFPAYFECLCKVNVSAFPVDRQNCRLRFGSWGFDIKGVFLIPKNDNGDIENFIGSGEWKLMGFPVYAREEHYGCCPNNYSLVDFHLILQRRSLYYTFHLLIPCVILTVINLFTFLLPVESGEKVSLNITLLLTMVVFLLLVKETLPPQSENIPILAVYLLASIVLMSLTTTASVFVIHLHYRDAKRWPMSDFVRRYVLGVLGRVMLYGGLMKRMKALSAEEKVPYIGPSRQDSACSTSNLIGGDVGNKIKSSMPIPVSYRKMDGLRFVGGITMVTADHLMPDDDTISACTITSSLYGIPDEMCWKLMAMVVDRLFFMLFTLATVCCTCYVFAFTVEF